MALTFTAGTSVESTGSVTSTTVTLPSGLAAGDYTIIVVSLNASSGSITTPAGWTNILASTNSVNGSTSDALAIFYRAWQSGDTNPAITTTSGRVAATPIRVQGADATTFVDVAATVTQAASGATTLTAPTITPTSSWLVCVFNGRNSSGGNFLTPFSNLSASMTQIAEASGKATSQTNAGHLVAYESVTPNSATGTRQADPAVTTTGGMGVSFSLNEGGGGGPSPQTVSPTGIASTEAFGSPSLGGETAFLSTFDDGTADGWTSSTGGAGSTAITSAAAHDGAFGASADVPAATGDKAGFTRSVGPSQSVTIRGWWKVTTEGASSGSNVPFARLFNGSQRLADVYRQNVVAGANVWLRVVKAVGGSNYYFIPTGFRLELDTWVYISFTWGLDGIPHLFINGVEYLNASDAPADFYAASQIDTAWLGSQEAGNQGAWAIDTIDAVGRGIPAAAEIRNEPTLTGEGFGAPSITISDPPAEVVPTGIATAEAFGTPSASATLTVSPSGVATAGAFGTAAISTSLTSSPAGVASAQAFGTPALSTTLATAPTGVASAQAFGSPSVSTTLAVTATGIASAQALGSPSVSTSLQASPTGIASGQALGSPSLTVPAGLSPSGIASEEAVGSPFIVATVELTPTGITSGEAFGTPNVSPVLPVSTTGIASAEAFGTLVIVLGTDLSPDGIPTEETFGTPGVTATLDVSPAGIATAGAFGSPSLNIPRAVAVTGIASVEAFGTLEVTVGPAGTSVQPTGIATGQAFGTPTLSGTRTSTPAGIPSLEAFGSPRWTSILVTRPQETDTGDGIGVPTITKRLTVSPSAVQTAEAFGVPTVEKIVLIVSPSGAVTLESFGAPRIVGGSASTPIEMAGSLTRARYSGRVQEPGDSTQAPSRWKGRLD